MTRRARRASVVLPPELASKLEAYYRLLATWNSKINLTGLNTADFRLDTFDRLLIEPLVAARYVPGDAKRMLLGGHPKPAIDRHLKTGN